VSAFAFIALAFCCLVIGQAVTAKINVQTVTGNSIDRPIPLPSGDLKGTVDGAAQSVGDRLVPVDEDAVLGPLYDKSLYPLYGGQPSQIVSSAKEGGEDIAGAVDISGALPITETGYTCDNTYDLDGSCGDYDGAPDVVYLFTSSAPAGVTQYVTISLCNAGTDYDTKLWVLASDGVTEIACNDDACPGYISELVGLALDGGESYYIVIGGYSPGDCGNYEMTVVAAPDPYDCQVGDTPEPEACGDALNNGGTNFGAISAGETICGTLFAAGGVRDNDYYHFDVTAPDGEDITFYCASDATMGYYIMLMNAAGTAYYTYSIGTGLDEVSIGPIFMPAGTWTIRVTMNVACPGACQDYGCGTNPLDLMNGNYRYRLSMDSYIPVAGDDCSLAQEVFDGSNTFDMTGYTPDVAGMLGYYGFGEYNGWFAYEASCNGFIHFELCPDQTLIGGATAPRDRFGMAIWPGCYESTFDPGLGTLAAFTWVNRAGTAWIDYTCSTDGTIEIVAPAMEGEVLYLEVFALNAPFAGFITGTVTVTCEELVAYNDACANAEDLGAGEVADLFIHNFAAGTDGAYLPNYGTTVTNTRCDDIGLNGNGLGGDVWYTWTADATGWWTVNTCDGAGWDGKLEIFEGFDCLYTTYRLPIACGDDDCEREGAGVMPNVEFYAENGDQFLFRLGGWYAPPDYPTPSMGTGYMNVLYSATAAVRPYNDACVNADVAVLDNLGTVISRNGTLDNASNHDCLMSPPMVWEACNLPDFCGNVAMDYCGTFGAAGVNDQNYYVADEVMYTECPCYDGVIVPTDLRLWDLCSQQYYLKTMYFNALTPATYYFPITPGF